MKPARRLHSLVSRIIVSLHLHEPFWGIGHQSSSIIYKALRDRTGKSALAADAWMVDIRAARGWGNFRQCTGMNYRGNGDVSQDWMWLIVERRWRLFWNWGQGVYYCLWSEIEDRRLDHFEMGHLECSSIVQGIQAWNIARPGIIIKILPFPKHGEFVCPCVSRCVRTKMASQEFWHGRKMAPWFY